jgi:hypothetical protein
MRHVWMIVVSARSVRSVKNSAPSKPGGIVAVYWPLSSHPLPVLEPQPRPPHPPACSPVLWRDWPRCQIRQKSDQRRAIPNRRGDGGDGPLARSIRGAHPAHVHPFRAGSLALVVGATALSQRPSRLFAPGDGHASWPACCFCSNLWVCPLRCCLKRNRRLFLLAFSPMLFYRATSLYRYTSIYASLTLFMYARLFQARCASRG